MIYNVFGGTLNLTQSVNSVNMLYFVYVPDEFSPSVCRDYSIINIVLSINVMLLLSLPAYLFDDVMQHDAERTACSRTSVTGVIRTSASATTTPRSSAT